MINNTFEEIGKALSAGHKILLFPHINADGDTVGSCIALCRALRQAGKECWILIEDRIPGNLRFLDDDYCTLDQDILGKPDISVCVDCSDMSRLHDRGKRFLTAGTTVCIDHHLTADRFCDLNYIDSNAAATGELIYKLLLACGVQLDKEIGEALFTAIVTDTGRFQYKNTSKQTHEIAAALYDTGIDAGYICTEIYESMRMEKLMIRNKALNTLSTVAGGKAVIAYVTQEMLSETGAFMDETDGVVEELRSIKGVEAAAFLKESQDGKIKVSFRSKQSLDVAEIAESFGGGGHIRAAGCTLACGLSDAYDQIKERLTACLGRV